MCVKNTDFTFRYHIQIFIIGVFFINYLALFYLKVFNIFYDLILNIFRHLLEYLIIDYIRTHLHNGLLKDLHRISVEEETFTRVKLYFYDHKDKYFSNYFLFVAAFSFLDNLESTHLHKISQQQTAFIAGYLFC